MIWDSILGLDMVRDSGPMARGGEISHPMARYDMGSYPRARYCI